MKVAVQLMLDTSDVPGIVYVGPSRFEFESGVVRDYDLSSYWETTNGDPIPVYVFINKFDPILIHNGIRWTFAPSLLRYDGKPFIQEFEGLMEFQWDFMPHPLLEA